jgi:tetratricopeptide (TPR) repeat protein
MRNPAAFAILLLLSALAFPARTQAGDAQTELQLGVESYKNARYEEAIRHFQRAATLDPAMVPARLYLATAYAQQYIPGADTPDNLEVGRKAVDEYKNVLSLDSSNLDALKGIAYLALQMKNFEESKEYYRKAITLQGDDPEPYYSIAVIDWTCSYQPRIELRHKLGLEMETPLIHMTECEELRVANQPLVDEGIEMLTRALELRPDYDDAMAYMNLLYRERADIQCGDSAAYTADLRTADRWVNRTVATKKAKSETSKPPSDTGEEDSQ